MRPKAKIELSREQAIEIARLAVEEHVSLRYAIMLVTGRQIEKFKLLIELQHPDVWQFIKQNKKARKVGFA